VTATNAYACKAALFALLAGQTGTGQPLEGVQVAYGYPGNADRECVYGGGVRFDHADAVAEGPGVLVDETASVGVYVRVVGETGQSLEEVDARIAELAAAVLGIVRANAKMGGPLTWVGMRTGQGDYGTSPDGPSGVLGLQLRFISKIAY
jgi:hypothetical protein